VEVIFISIAVLFIVGYFEFSKEKTSYKKTTKQSDTDPSASEKTKGKESTFSEVFNETFLALAAFVIKSDDDIAQIELERVRNYFKTYYPGQERLYFERLNSYLKKDIDIEETCKAILNAGFNDKFQMMSQLFNIASADSHIYISEYVALYDISNLLKLSNLTFITIRGLFDVSFTYREVLDFKEQSFRKEMNDWRREFDEQQRQEEQQRRQKEKRKQEQYWKKQQSYNNYYKKKSKKESFSKKPQSKLDGAYIILGLEKGTSLKQIKKAFRKLAHIHHPDKVAHLGEGSVKQAEVVFRKIKDAYELIISTL